MQIYDCAIIGGGPAGLVSALYLRRYHRSILLFDGGESRANYIPKIRNLVGYSGGISGARLLKNLKKQITQFEAEIINEKAQIYRNRNFFDIKAGSKSYRVKKVILATGMKDVQPEVLNYWELCKLGVLAYCPICDGFEQTNQKIGVIIDSDSGIRKLKFLSHFSNSLNVIAIKRFKLSPTHTAFVKKMKIKIHWGPIEKLSYHSNSKSLIVKQKGKTAYMLKLAYVMLGTKVNTSATKHIRDLARTKGGFLKVNSHQETSVPGLYAVGDCVNSLSQISVAAGHAATAATDVHNHLSKNS